ncbi:MAG: tRNA (adenosine(37)-N6)-threonylcarbamoyltransferase complex transferase subunit TsaD [Candidatus Latescibacteria bacterium]|nr:tRNA (adenosine(37)-N6)-threonylcarbamoyltransferase complex transferase subunit TsaD [Candidatus Latescibacterota bacterium]
MVVLGIETSCDETSAAVLGWNGEILSNVIFSQIEHARYGGVVPELASRAHIRKLVTVIEEALSTARCSLSDVEGIAVTRGPGLVGALLVGISFAKAVAAVQGIPFIAVNHLEGHLFSLLLERPDIRPPFLALIVSGGHTELVLVSASGVYRVLGRTRDDAAGEAFDKVAKILRLFEENQSIMGGPLIARLAAEGDPTAIAFPRGMVGEGFDFSFSGLKTAVFTYIDALSPQAVEQQKADIAASFQAAVVDVLVEKSLRAALSLHVQLIVVVGGVAANTELRARLCKRGELYGLSIVWPSSGLCTDNAAMIAAVGQFRLKRGECSDFTVDAVSRWGVEEI